METKGRPVQMLAWWREDGRLEPLRFRVEDEESVLQTVSISRVLAVREVAYVGAEAIFFRCLGELAGLEKLFELRYALRDHKWTVRLVF